MTVHGTRSPQGVSARIGIALVACLALAFLLPDGLATVRLTILGWVASPVEPWLAPREPGPSPLLPRSPDAVPPPAGFTSVAVLDVRKDRGTLVIGAGAESGIEYGEIVTIGDAVVGFVDRIDRHLSRVQLLNHRESSVAITGGRPTPAPSGAILRHVGLLKGGTPPRILKAPLPAAFAAGEEILTMGGEGTRVPAGLRIGTIEEAGLVPTVKLAADPTAVGRVQVRRRLREGTALFFDEPVTIAAYPLTLGGSALIRGQGLRDAIPGLALTREGRFLGRLVETASSSARVTLVTDEGHEVVASWVDDVGQRGSGILRSLGKGVFDLRVLGGVAPGFAMNAFTAGGQALIPEGLYIGRLVPENGRWHMKDVPPVPRHAVVPIFLETGAWRKFHPEETKS